MDYVQNELVHLPTARLADDASVAQLLLPLLPFLEAADVTDIVVNEPHTVLVEQGARWQSHTLPGLTFDHCMSLAVAIATYTHQDLSRERPLLSATLPGGQRIQLAIPPVCPAGRVSITIRLPSRLIKGLDSFEKDGFFDRLGWRSRGRYARPNARLAELAADDQQLIQALVQGQYRQFFEHAVRVRKNIAIVGDTGAGKTTFMKALCLSIPADERLVTIEDVREIFLPNHPNCVHLLYSKDDQGLAQVTPASLIASTMRMRPDRVLLAELRGGEAFDFLKLLTTGHAGSLTSFHAQSCALALERFVLMAREHPQASRTDDVALYRLLELTVDVIAHCARDGPRRYVSELYFDPLNRLEQARDVARETAARDATGVAPVLTQRGAGA